MIWYSHLFMNFPVFCNPQRFSVVNEVEVDFFFFFFLEFLCFLYDPMDVGNLISGSSTFSKTSLFIWKFSVHIQLKPSLNNFEHYLASMWNESNFTEVWTFFGIAFLWNRNASWPFPVLWPLLVYQICWHIEYSTLILFG